MLEDTIIDYVLNHYSRLMTLREAAAIKHYTTSSKFPKMASAEDGDHTKNLLLAKGWLSNNEVVAELLKNGYQQFRQKTAERILNEQKAKVYFNYCTKCGRLARSPLAKQCRHCGYSWHKQTVATFQITSAFRLSARETFFVLGDILTGSIEVGMRIDLIVLGLAVKPMIKAIETALHTDDGMVWENIGLGFTDLSNDDQEFLKTGSPFLTPVPIESGNIRTESLTSS